MIARPRLDPARSRRAVLTLPERRLCLQPVHQIVDRLERGAAMLRRRGDEHHCLAGLKDAVAMNDGEAKQGETLACIFGNLVDNLAGEGRMMLELELPDLGAIGRRSDD